ncbi:galactosylgalactosylxylosylprotein 3-beta-glucuronosyltransferase I isoform X2 [Amyelois transitella]|uniref:galactosylgalactosylxylosylprotein 3-beta-glucuronosyltransferase I isoform X1 n=1 Tax=Amyelois transitella TaxID=680683 RepID=UPI00067C39FE|nr:galactosylgalactosylxylosylprotein 3-beta-glucuronosyltransferase I isoform X1 [Amyelois transitella]XP_060804116.1 galactosylgalactosylxylosylprotein 3-beta-glucuronosyltransferase I isoform X2 [Amyelois transitella]
MPFVNIKKQYLAIGMLIFVILFFFNSKPAFQCQISTDNQVVSYLPIIYGITPTYTRLAQKADLTRLSQTLMLVKNFHWIVVEDAETKTDLVKNFLKETGLKYTHLNVKTHSSKHSTASGVEQRNLALDWLRDHLAKIEDKRGVVYFMDDDNTYALKVFDEMRKINKVGTWPVGIVGGMRVEMPVVTDGKITGFNAVWKPFRPFPIDMAGFAINATLFLEKPDAKFSRKVQSGFQESEILKYFTTKDELEPLAENCTKVYVWHTRTQKPSIINPKKLKHPPVISDAHIEV